MTAEQIRKNFRNASRSQAGAATVPSRLETLEWDQRDFLGWRDEKFPSRAYLTVTQGEEVITLLLRAPASTAGRPGRAICSLCHSTRPNDEVLLFVAPRAGKAGKDGDTVGTYICEDLACSLYVRELIPLELPQSESGDPEERAASLRERVDGFVGRVLGA